MRIFLLLVCFSLIGVRALKAEGDIPEESQPCSDFSEIDMNTVGQVCHTSVLKRFEVVLDDYFGDYLGIGLKELDDPKHTTWELNARPYRVNYDQSSAICPDGTHTPSNEDFVRLRNSFPTELNKDSGLTFDPASNKEKLTGSGMTEFHRLFPDMKDHEYWSSTPVITSPVGNNRSAFVFVGNTGAVTYYYQSNFPNGVRCVH